MASERKIRLRITTEASSAQALRSTVDALPDVQTEDSRVTSDSSLNFGVGAEALAAFVAVAQVAVVTADIASKIHQHLQQNPKRRIDIRSPHGHLTLQYEDANDLALLREHLATLLDEH